MPRNKELNENQAKPKIRKAQRKYDTAKKNKPKGSGLDKDIIIESIKPYLQLGYSVKKSCLLAGVAYTTVHTWLRENPSLRVLVYSFQNIASVTARKNIVTKVKEGDVANSWQWLKHRDKDFNTPLIIQQNDEWDEEQFEDEENTREATEDLEKILKENNLA